MFEAFLATTSTEGLQPLGTAAQRSFELVSGTVRDRLGAEHAALFAEPVATAQGDVIDWHGTVSGRVMPLPDLPDEDRDRLRAHLGRLVGDIRAEADRLAQSDAAEDQRLSEALRNAVEIPDESMVRVVRDKNGDLHPVLVHWAWVRDAQSSVRGVLTAMIPRPVSAVDLGTGPVSAPAGLHPGWWWLIVLGWLLLALMLGYILYLLVAPCGVNQRGLIFCPREGPAIHAALVERQAIENQIAGLEHELALRDRTCQPTIPILPATPQEPAEPEKGETGNPAAPAFPAPQKGELDGTGTDAERADADRRITERGASRGALNFVLEWASRDDIDLSVTCPSGETISYKNRAACGATYDLDANVKRANAVEDPVENIVFADLVPGLYTVRAHLKSNRTDGDKEVTLHVLRRDGKSNSYTGVLGDGRAEWSVNISISG